MASNPLYEMLYIIDTSLGDEEVKRYQDEVRNLILENGGEIRKESNWGNRRLAFEIRKKTEGAYINIEFWAPPSAPAAIYEYVNTHHAILRHLCIAVPKAKLVQEKLDADKEKKQIEDAQKEREEILRRQREAEEREKAAAAATAEKSATEEGSASEESSETATATESAPESAPETVSKTVSTEPTSEEPKQEETPATAATGSEGESKE